MSEKIDGWKIWSRNWENAKRFFLSRGNIKTRSRLKTKWFNDFEKDILAIYENAKEKEIADE